MRFFSMLVLQSSLRLLQFVARVSPCNHCLRKLPECTGFFIGAQSAHYGVPLVSHASSNPEKSPRMASYAVAAVTAGHLPLSRTGLPPHGENRWCARRSCQARGRQAAPVSVSTPRLPHEHVTSVHQGLFEDRRVASALTSAYFPTGDDGNYEDDDEYYVQYKQHLRKVVQGARKNLDGQCVFLTGMMGSGKSTIGEILAQNLHYGFVDSDKLVEKVTGYDSVSEIFAKVGEEGFRGAESQTLQWLCDGLAKLRRPVVVALGGGALVQPENWIIAKRGILVYIDVPSEILAKRIVAAGTGVRPIFPPRCTEIEAQNLLDVLYNQREETYGMAKIRVEIRDLSAKLRLSDASTLPAALVAFEVLKKIEKLGGVRDT